MRVISKSGEYGLRALMYMVAHREEGAFVSIRDMAEQLDISFHFLTKILQSLTQAGILKSYRGPNGGVAFNIPPEKVLLSDVVHVLEGDDFFDKCLLGLPGCGKLAPCPMHHIWKEIKGTLKHEFETTSMAEMGQSALLNRIGLVA